MATKNKNSKKQSNNIAATIFTFVLSLALVAIIFFGIFVLIYDPLKDSDGDKKDEAETTDVKKDLKTNTDEEKPEPEPEPEKPNDGETTYGEDKAGYESEKDQKPVERNESGKKVATTSLNIAQNDTVIILSGRVTNFKEEGGTCTYRLKGATGSKEYPVQVIPDAKYTVCEAVKLDKKALGSGQWTVWMEYKSNNAEGKSETQAINI